MNEPDTEIRDLSRLQWQDLPRVTTVPLREDGVSFEVRGGLSHPSWGENGPVVYLRVANIFDDRAPGQTWSWSLPVGAAEAVGRVLIDAAKTATVDKPEVSR